MAKNLILWYNNTSKGGGNMNSVFITTEYITIGQLLKLVGVVTNGGEIKHFIAENDVFLDGKLIKERGKKVYPGSVVSVFDTSYTVKSENVG